jgi:putative membrane protein
MIASVIATTGVAGAASFSLTTGYTGLTSGLIFGLLGFAAPIIVSDLITEIFYHDDPLLTPRRINIISFVLCLATGVLLIVVGMLSGFTGRPDLLLRGVLLTVYSSAGLRLLIFSVFSTRGATKTALAISVQPLLMAIATYYLDPDVWRIPLTSLLAVLILILLGPTIILVRISRWNFSDETLRIIPLFRAFVYAWAEQHNEPFEEQLAMISEPARLETDEVLFTDSTGCCIGRVVAPYIHPGPFRNVGSSGLSLAITEGLGGGCETLVAHGVSSHERDLARSADMEKVLSSLRSATMSTPSNVCSLMTRGEVSGAKASCQIFGDTALFTLTLSPKSHDDIPDTVKDRVREAASQFGLNAVVVDAHNCINDDDILDERDADNLVAASQEALRKAAEASREPFMTGFSRVKPEEWGLDEGMGPCGIGAIVVHTREMKYAYLIFDTNNVIQGLREKLLEHVTSLGYADAEILSSDTHLVNAIGATDRGYHPAGEVMELKKVYHYIEEALKGVTLTPAMASYARIAVDDVQIIGDKGIELLRMVVKTSFKVFIRTAATALPLTFIAATTAAFLL